MRRGRLLFFIIGMFALPALASAAAGQVVITDIMYDPSGSDTGHEYIELENTGTSSIRLTDLKLRIDGSNHKIVALADDGVLVSQARAAITQDAALFAADVSGFDGVVFHASFSLTNTSGTVAIVDKTGVVIASKTYHASPKVAAPKPQKVAKPKASNKAIKVKTEEASVAPEDGAETDTDGVSNAADVSQVAVASTAQSGSLLWWWGVAALALGASAATFAARRVAKREWDIVEEREEDV